ncbi:CapA family protein [Bdellovibrio sp. HCB337]|uniref:CapA family protein n=1 Tax=Bdellovibrio sp. HCB337 TaxID=3394358 RepID=UPI0039A739F2
MRVIFNTVLCLGFTSTLWAAPRDLSFNASCNQGQDVATISFVGDILVHRAIYESVVNGSKRFASTWQKTIPYFQKADFSVGNLEGPAALGIDAKGKDHGDIGFVYDGVVYSGTNFVFNYHPQILPELLQSGFDLLTLANNHSLDRRSIGIDRTLQAAAHYGIPTVGTRKSNDPKGDFYEIKNIQNIRVAFIGCTEMTNGMPDKYNQVLWCYKQADKIVEMIKDLSRRSDVDAIAVLPHWGDEYENGPDRDQKSYARKFLEAGATAVIGSHPHVLQPWEKYTTQDGRETLIAYSLGNFLAGQPSLEKQTGAIVYLGLSKEGQGKAKIFGVGYTPTYRDGNEIFPIEKNGNASVLAHAAGHFGTIGRLDLQTMLSQKFCK